MPEKRFGEDDEALVRAILPLIEGLDHRRLASDEAASRAGIDPELFNALVQVESGGNPKAKSSAGAVGPAQLMPSAARAVGMDPAHLTNPGKNLNAGALYLALMLKQFKQNVSHALAAYNAGPTAVRRHGGVPPFKETQNHVDRVLAELARGQ